MSQPPVPIIFYLMRGTQLTHNHRTYDHGAVELLKRFSRTFPHMSYISHILSSPLPRDVETAKKAFAPALDSCVPYQDLLALAPGLESMERMSPKRAGFAAELNNVFGDGRWVVDITAQLASNGRVNFTPNKDLLEIVVVANPRVLCTMIRDDFSKTHFHIGEAKSYILTTSGRLLPVDAKDILKFRKRWASRDRSRDYRAGKAVLEFWCWVVGVGVLVVVFAVLVVWIWVKASFREWYFL